MTLVLVIHCIKILINKNVEVIVFGVGNCTVRSSVLQFRTRTPIFLGWSWV